MALKKLGSTYLVGADDRAELHDDVANYRGNKDFLIWLDSSVAEFITVTGTNTKDGARSVKVLLYQCSNLLANPGTEIFSRCFEVPSGNKKTGSVTLPPDPVASGLYRLRILPVDNQPLITVDITSPWYSMECIEPENSYYVFGPGSGSPYEQYFFVPKLADGETIRARLESEKGYEWGYLQVFNAAGEKVCDMHTDPDKNRPGGEFTDQPFFNSAEITETPTVAPGEIWKFVLSRNGGSSPSKPPSGNNWVRFSRNVPPYFSPTKEGLIYPIVHRNFKPFSYCNTPGPPAATQTYRAYLTVQRSGVPGAIVPLQASLNINVNGLTDSATGSDYVAEVNLAIPVEADKVTGSQAAAQLMLGTQLLADSTDKVDTVYFVKKPSWTNWPSPRAVLAYDNGNGKNATDDLENAGFTAIQISDEEAIQNLVDHNMKAVGAIYDNQTHPIKTWFWADKSNALSSNVLFWMMWDEPDAATGEKGENLKPLYDLYYKHTDWATKPYSLNISNPIYIEEFCEACDVIITDPYVYKDSTDGKQNQNRIKVTGEEMNRVAGTDKQTIIVLWWWFPDKPEGVLEGADVVYGESWDKGVTVGVSGLGGYNFSKTFRNEEEELVTNILSTYETTGPVADLWNMVKAKIAE